MQNSPVQGQPIVVPTDILNRSADRLQAQLRSADEADSAKRDSELKKASQEFESLFIAYLLKVMRDTIVQSGLTEGGFGKEVYTELFDQEVSRGIAQHGALGISELIYRRLSAQAPLPVPGGEAKPEKGDPKPPSHVPPSPRIDSPDKLESEIPDFKLPLQAPISSGYGIRKDPFSHQLRQHMGIDLAAPEGTEVRAAQGGRVVFAGCERDYGNSVIVQHPEGFQTRYAHLGSTSVKAGDIVACEEVLGVVGTTGHSTGPHLHFEVIRNGERIDPAEAMTE
jgi:murein DD-endopeptidase MepM/ murein hydrolase activator NlpD